MKTKQTIKYVGLALLAAVGLSSCSTTYDAYGRPVQSVDPGAAAVGAVAIGAAAYAIGSNNNNNYKKRPNNHHRPPHRPRR